MGRRQKPVIIHLDTHVALWLAAGEKRRLRRVARPMRQNAMELSPLVLLEIAILHEIGRIRFPVGEIWELLRDDYGVREASGHLQAIGIEARGLTWTRDPFDRLIVAHAVANDAQLLTADATILRHCASARWDR